MKNKKPLFFAAVRRGKAYVSYYRMPLYFYAARSKAISPELKKRQQGKWCFNCYTPLFSKGNFDTII